MLLSSDLLYTRESIRRIEVLSAEQGLEDRDSLLNRAATASLKLLLEEWPQAHDIAIFCGPGMNGADGLTLGYLAHQRGLKVRILLIHANGFKGKASLQAAESCRALNIPVEVFRQGQVIQADLIVDALFGIGLDKELGEEYRVAINAINESALPVFSLDVPSGINADTGADYGAAVRADLTLSFIALKQGLFTHRAMACCGRILCDDLDLPESLIHSLPPSARRLNWKQMKRHLPRRVRDANKACYGHVLVIGGDYGMGGAVRMAAEAALRVGAGLVSVATRPEHVCVVNASRPELMCHQILRADDLDPLLAKATVVIIGPGLGQCEWSKKLLAKVLQSDLPKVLDADSLNLLSENPRALRQAILTPHPGEAARLLGITISQLQENRFQAAQQIQERYQALVVLKGAGTLIQAEENGVPALCHLGNPGMASAGMGDVLSGVIGGLLAQGFDKEIAAELGVFVHAVAADRAAEEGGERGLLACDLMPHLRRLVNPYEALVALV